MSTVGDYRQPIRCWTDRRKRELLGAISAGRISEARARLTHNIAEDELDLWQFQFGHDGGRVGRRFGRTGAER